MTETEDSRYLSVGGLYKNAGGQVFLIGGLDFPGINDAGLLELANDAAEANGLVPVFLTDFGGGARSNGTSADAAASDTKTTLVKSVFRAFKDQPDKTTGEMKSVPVLYLFPEWYTGNGKVFGTYNICAAYFDRPDQVEAFETLSGVKLSDIPESQTMAAPQRPTPNVLVESRYLHEYVLPKPVYVVTKAVPYTDKETGKEKQTYKFVRFAATKQG